MKHIVSLFLLIISQYLSINEILSGVEKISYAKLYHLDEELPHDEFSKYKKQKKSHYNLSKKVEGDDDDDNTV